MLYDSYPFVILFSHVPPKYDIMRIVMERVITGTKRATGTERVEIKRAAKRTFTTQP